MKKRILSIALALFLLFILAPAASAAGETLTFMRGEEDWYAEPPTGDWRTIFTVSNAFLSDETLPMGWEGINEYVPVYYVLDGLSVLTIVTSGWSEGVYINGIGSWDTMIDEETGVEYFHTLSPPIILYTIDSIPDYFDDDAVDRLNIDEMLLTHSIVEWYEPYNHDSFFSLSGFVFKFVDELPDNPSTLTPQVTVNVNGNPISFDQPPIIQEGRTLVPLRAIFEALGADVEWEDATQTVTAVRQGVAIEMQIGNSVFSVNGEQKTLDVPPQLVGGRTLVPVRAIAESFGAEVGWDQDTSTVTITE